MQTGLENSKRFTRVFNDKRPMLITHPTKIVSPIAYYPDATYETKMKRNYVFEVMDSEANRQALVVAHVLEAVLSHGVQKVFFVVQSVKDQDSVGHIARVVLASLEDLSGGKIGKGIQFYFIVISRKDARSYERAKGIIAEELNLAQSWRTTR